MVVAKQHALEDALEIKMENEEVLKELRVIKSGMEDSINDYNKKMSAIYIKLGEIIKGVRGNGTE